MSSRTIIASVAGTALMLTLVGCSPSARDAAVTMGGTPGEICLPVPPGGVFVYGEFLTLDPGVSPMKLVQVELNDSHGVELVRSSALNPEVGTGIMSMSLDDPLELWKERKPLDEVTLGEEPVNVVVELRRTGSDRGTVGSVRVNLSGPNGESYADGSTTIVMDDSCDELP